MDLKRIFIFCNIYIKRPAGTGENGKMVGNVRKNGENDVLSLFYKNESAG